ncbi:hTAFII28-like protein conserved region-domain-containing protein [Massariosphaeria phaeospora]|uniref:HTAFII28-like protein conserved region-domain-containing protein n=1 Tax=Massariosphaeria phaeospora TaxID=100035 RepID=A0A7C8IBI8_9PLEO|nr:hTAFII28-like protein conserved region-domain-containing protein [Massariosphaeria phaeospora]
MASPPHLPQLNIPRKRSSISSVTSAAKKRKPSQLRNSFAPESEAVGSPLRYSRSPSVDSVATTSVVNGAGGKKRKRKDADTASVTGSSVRGGKAPSAADGGGDGAAAEGAEGDEEEDDDLEEEMDAVLEGGKVTEATKKQEKEHERILMEAMDPNQSDRYATYRRIRLKREIVRKLVNQTLSQSVPQPVIIAVTSYSKGFVGELVDRALTVRDEWAASRSHVPNTAVPAPILAQGIYWPTGHRTDAKPSNQHIQAAGMFLNQVDRDEGFWSEVQRDAPLSERLKTCDKGPLTPAHLREALRRYKRDRDGGGAGFAGLSLEGPERTLGRTGGRRLFR